MFPTHNEAWEFGNTIKIHFDSVDNYRFHERGGLDKFNYRMWRVAGILPVIMKFGDSPKGVCVCVWGGDIQTEKLNRLIPLPYLKMVGFSILPH